MTNAACILTYNNRKELPAFWANFTRNEHPLHVVIVDNASTDGTAEMFTSGGIPVTVNPVNNYYSAGMNQCLRKALEHDVEWVYCLNADLILEENWDAAIVEPFTHKNEVGIVGCRLTTPNGELHHAGGIVGKPKPVYWDTSYQLGNGNWEIVQPDVVAVSAFRHDLRDHQEPRRAVWATFACVALRAKMLRQVGLLDETYALYISDLELALRASEYGWETWYNPQASFTHQVGASVKVAGSAIHELAKADLRRFGPAEEKWLLSLVERRVSRT